MQHDIIMKSTEITSEVYDYIVQARTPDDALPDELRARTRELGPESEMSITPEQGTLLSILVGISGAQRAIEIGTFTGMSSLYIARALPPEGQLVCCDISGEWTQIAQEWWQRANLSEKIELRLGPAAQTLQQLAETETFDFAFIDADKPGYDTYYELLLPHLRPNALIVFDNMLRDGRVARPAEQNDGDRALDILNRKLAQDPRVESVLLPIADGIHLARVK